MKFKMNTFGKVITIVFCLLVPILALYAYSHQVSVKVVQETVESGNQNRLAFFMTQMEMMVDQLMKYSVIASRDSSLRQYVEGRGGSTPVEQLQKKMEIVERLNMQIATSGWNTQLILHLPAAQEVISTDYSVEFDPGYIERSEMRQWSYRRTEVFGATSSFFSRIRETDLPNVLVEVRFSEDNIKNMLNLLKQGATSEPFLYKPGMEPILNRTADHTLIRDAVEQLEQMELKQSGSQAVTLNRQQYLMNYVRSDSLGWYLIDFVLVDSIYAPIEVSGYLFYASAGLLMVLSILATLLLYRHVQMPIQMLIRGVQKLKEGQYSARLQKQPNNEFDYLFHSFNEMAERIEELIENVYKERLRSREATLKQLQSQINPHFLYNCLFYIKNMASLGDKEAVTAMALNLGEYYRYTTRLENPMTTVREELKLVENYLKIQTLRLQRLYYEIDVPETMLDMNIPRLLLQPIVENAVIHGIETSLDFGMIVIKGECGDGECRIIVDDNGKGLSEDAMEQLYRQLNEPMDEQTGCGLWNIHQRLIHLYQGQSGLRFSKSPLNGLRVELVWERPRSPEQEGEADVKNADCR